MTHEEHQANLLDLYLSALQNDKNAVIPDGLEPEIAEFAHMFVTEQTTNKTTSARQSRVWDEVQTSLSTSPNHNANYQNMEHYMSDRKQKNKPANRLSGWLPLAATAVVSIIISLGASSILFGKGSNAPQNEEISSVMVSTPTATATPTAIPSVTQFAPGTSFMPSIPTILPPTIIMPTLPAIEEVEGIFNLQATIIPQETLQCDFEGEFIFRINQNQVSPNETLEVSGAIRNRAAERLTIEIFGGFLTNDDYQLVTESDVLPSIDTVLALIDGIDYPAGSYLVQIRLFDSSGETLSSCGLPVTFLRQ